MKKNHILSTIGCAVFLFLAIGCSHSDELSNDGKQETPQGIRFSFSEADFGDDEILTRTNTVQKEDIDFADCAAQITVESESANPQYATRAINGPRHYTIRAYQGGVRIGEIKGTFNGNLFTPDASSAPEIHLPSHGTYDFIAFNDDVVPVGDELTVALNKAATARIGITTENINQDPKQGVAFTMKHVGARVKLYYIARKDIPVSLTANIVENGSAPVSVSYSAVTKTYTPTLGSLSLPFTSNTSTETKYTSWRYTATTDYQYFLPGTQGSQLKLSFTGGKVYWNNLNGSSISKLNTTLNIQSGKSYKVKIRMNPNYTYLFSDGTTGFYKQTTQGGGTKRAVGIVINKAEKIAIALQSTQFDYRGNVWSTKPGQRSNNMVNTFQDALASTVRGYTETWDAGSSTDGVVKGNSADYPAFQLAGEYGNTLGQTGTLATRKWYLGAVADWKDYIATACFGDVDAMTQPSHRYPWYSNLFMEAFSQVGGQGPLTGTTFTSTECTPGRPIVTFPSFMGFEWRVNDGGNPKVTPFIKYAD